MAEVHKKVLRVDRSPMNPQQWCCQLACGHDQWVTAKSKPRRARIKCDRCTQEMRDA